MKLVSWFSFSYARGRIASKTLGYLCSFLLLCGSTCRMDGKECVMKGLKTLTDLSALNPWFDCFLPQVQTQHVGSVCVCVCVFFFFLKETNTWAHWYWPELSWMVVQPIFFSTFCDVSLKAVCLGSIKRNSGVSSRPLALKLKFSFPLQGTLTALYFLPF